MVKMGLTKQWLERIEERGWKEGPNCNVCGDCVDDEFLAAQVTRAASTDKCDYCNAQSSDDSPIAAPVDVLIELVAETVHRYWVDPAEELPFESAEGGYQGNVMTTEEMLQEEIGVGWPDSLLKDVVDALVGEAWCKRDYFICEPAERLQYGWADFERTTKHFSRYASLLPPLKSPEWEHPDELPPHKMLDEVGECIETSSFVRTLPKDSVLYRARAHAAGRGYRTARQLGAPTTKQARTANRMSAAGIAVFYGTLDETTAVVETFKSSEKKALTVAAFKTTRELNLLDLCNLPETPSYFDVDRAQLRDALIFLRGFVRAVSRSIKKDGREHIEYVPTQIFAEFVRHRLVTTGSRIHGIIYPSAQKRGGKCCVLFCDQSACLPKRPGHLVETEQWLELDKKSPKVLRTPFIKTIG